jgi:hypothetical protein
METRQKPRFIALPVLLLGFLVAIGAATGPGTAKGLKDYGSAVVAEITSIYDGDTFRGELLQATERNKGEPGPGRGKPRSDPAQPFSDSKTPNTVKTAKHEATRADLA